MELRKKDHSLQRILRCHSVETTPVQVLMVDSFIYIFSASALIICHFHFYFDYFGSVNPSMVTRLHGIFIVYHVSHIRNSIVAL